MDMSDQRTPEIPGPIAQLLAIRQSAGAAAIAVGNRAGVVEWTNTAWRRVAGWPLEDVIDKPIQHLLDRIGIERPVLDFVQSHFLSGRVCAVELEIEGADGRAHAFHLEVEPVPDETGEVARFIAVARTAGPGRGKDETPLLRGADAVSDGDAVSTEADRVVTALQEFADETLRAANEIERLCAEIERTTGIGLLDEFGVRSVRERAEEAAEIARGLLERGAASAK